MKKSFIKSCFVLKLGWVWVDWYLDVDFWLWGVGYIGWFFWVGWLFFKSIVSYLLVEDEAVDGCVDWNDIWIFDNWVIGWKIVF